MKIIGVIGSNSTTTYAPLVVHEAHESSVKEEQLVLVEDHTRSAKYLGVIRRVVRYDPFLLPYRRTAYADNPDLVEHGAAPFGSAYVYLIGTLTNGFLGEVTLPPNPGSKVFVIERGDSLNVELGKGLNVGRHKYSGIPIPLYAHYLPYHIAVIGSTGTGKSRLVKILVDEILEKTNFSVIIFDHTGIDYVGFYPESCVVRSSDIILEPDIVSELMLTRTKLYRERTTYEKYFLFATVYYLALKTGTLTPSGQQQLEGFVRASRLPMNMDIQQVLSNLDFNQLMKGLKKGVEWDIDEFKGALRAVSQSVGRGRESSALIRAVISTDLRLGKSFFENLAKRRMHPREVVEKSLQERLTIVDMSHDFDLVTKRYVISSILNEVWKKVEEVKGPINMVVAIDEAHNYASEDAYGSVEDIEKVAREGRKWGYGLILATQRVIDIAPRIRGNINTVFFSKLQTVNDFRELAGYVDLGGISGSSLSILGAREFYVAGLMNPLRVPMLLTVKEVTQ